MTPETDHDFQALDKMMAEAEIARAVIALRHPTQPAEDIQEAMSCPLCGIGTLDYYVSSVNYHISASCTTDGCVNFME